MKNGFFKNQLWHLIAIVVLIYLLDLIFNTTHSSAQSSFLNISTSRWFWIAVFIPILHEIYVMLVWRLELYYNFFTSRFGLQTSFTVYKIIFLTMFILRLVSVICLAISDKNSLTLNPIVSYLIALLFGLLTIYLMYSVLKYFTITRALGMDHFDKNFNKPFVKEGIFRFTNNGMYLYGFLGFYVPGLLLYSKLALIVALFAQIYIWVHYFCTEKPDMEKIYR